MDKLFEIFFVNKDKPISAWFIIIFGLLGCSATILLGLPQAIHLFKNKKSGNVKYYSYWTFFVGILGWIFIGSFDPSQKNFVLVIANIICGFIYIFVIWFIYRYAEKPKNKKHQWTALSISFLLQLFTSIIAICALKQEWKVNKLVQAVIGQIVPILTTFAFLPQLLKSFETKDFSGMSIGMVIMFVVSNIFWCSYWISFIENAGPEQQYLSAITWQFLSLFIYCSQLIFMTIQNRKNKNNKTL
ncbi:PQ-loop domain-containing transporter [Mycoplasma tauri]|uniref:PQ loop repeat protein n=1 Tax=Mycoplasma tauri TaxID=547987 RepID=A0A953T6N0_9MOLU|nr:PQ-loop domain-containing transporter [Mycoplasma tauri]MBZ4195346.1 hypothetical protein [Mycoplasma tauri]MBZ4218319.1 hypothetical protein [Mycoplasma tauri]